MARKPRTKKGEVIVLAILDATVSLLAERGYAELNTNRIAKRAGISIGSFYQYFENKEAVVAELARLQQERMLDRLNRCFAAAQSEDLAGAAALVLSAFFGPGAGDARVRRVLVEEVAPSWIRHASIDPFAESKVAEFLERRGVRAPAEAAFIIVQTVAGVVDNALRRRPEALADGTIEHELNEIVVRYLQGR